MPLPPYAPELNPVEQLWLNIKQRYLSNMAFKDYKHFLGLLFIKSVALNASFSLIPFSKIN
jgi:transposase